MLAPTQFFWMLFVAAACSVSQPAYEDGRGSWPTRQEQIQIPSHHLQRLSSTVITPIAQPSSGDLLRPSACIPPRHLSAHRRKCCNDLRQFTQAPEEFRGLDLPAESTYTISEGEFDGRIREAAFKLFGTAPALAKTLRAPDPVLMHAHFGSDGLSRFAPCAKRLGIPLS